MWRLLTLKQIGILLLIYLFIEIFSFIIVCRWLGILTTISLLVISTLLGAYILRHISRQSRGRMMTTLQTQKLMQLLSGFLLLMPGFVSDILGLLLLVPPVQRLMLSLLLPKFLTKKASVKPAGCTIEGQYWREDDKNSNKK